MNATSFLRAAVLTSAVFAIGAPVCAGTLGVAPPAIHPVTAMPLFRPAKPVVFRHPIAMGCTRATAPQAPGTPGAPLTCNPQQPEIPTGTPAKPPQP